MNDAETFSAWAANPGNCRFYANTGAEQPRHCRALRTDDQRYFRPSCPTLSLCRHARGYGKTRFDHGGNAASRRGFLEIVLRNYAQLDPLSAFDISRPKIGSRSGFRSVEEPGSRIENARKTVWRATLAVGGLGSAGGSCIWHVVGWQQSLKEWALEQGWNGRRVSPGDTASGDPDCLVGYTRRRISLNQQGFANIIFGGLTIRDRSGIVAVRWQGWGTGLR